VGCGCIYVDVECGERIVHKAHRWQRQWHELKCDECGRVIQPGEKYEHVEAIWGEGRPLEVHRTCVICHEIREEFFCYGYIYGMVWEDIRTHFEELGDDIPSDCIAKLSKPAQEYLCDVIDQWWGEVNDDEE